MLGSLIIDVAGLTLTQEDRELLTHQGVGGVILFARNYTNKAQLTKLCAEIREAAINPLLILVDQEGGRVQRFREEFTKIPPMAYFGKLYDQDPAKALNLIEELGWLLATELLEVGIDASLAPVLDINQNDNVIGDRSFHHDPHVIAELAQALISGMNRAGMAATGKHFPGHGTAKLDSHHDFAVDTRSFAEVEANDARAFIAMIDAGISSIMPAHIIFPNIDTKPVGFSDFWLQEILRQRYGFKGLIISDDLSMKAATFYQNPADRVSAAKTAGCDFVLLCNDRAGVKQVLNEVELDALLLAKEKWQLLQAKPKTLKNVE